MNKIKWSEAQPIFHQKIKFCMDDLGLVTNQETRVFLTIVSQAEVEAANRRNESIPQECLVRLPWSSIIVTDDSHGRWIEIWFSDFTAKNILGILTQENKEKFFNGN